MSKDVISVELKPRKTLGKGLNKLRAGGLLPAVIHDHGNPSIHVEGDIRLLSKAYEQAGKHHPVEIKVGDKQHLTLIKDADVEPVKQRLRHIVFQAIKQDEKVEAEIPIILEGEIPAEKASLMVITSLDSVEVEALPKDLPDSISIDASVLAEIGDRITVADLKAPEGVTILTEPDQAIARVEMPKDQIAEADAAAADLAADAERTADSEEAGEEAGEAAEEGEAESASAGEKSASAGDEGSASGGEKSAAAGSGPAGQKPADK